MAARRQASARRDASGAAPDKRAAILAAAFTLFGRYGYRRTSMEEVAREAGIAKGTIYLYFDTKEALFRALSQAAIDHVLAAAAEAAASDTDVAERLTAMLDAKFGYFHDAVHRSPHARELIDSKSQLSADLFAAADAAYRALLVQAVQRAVRRRELDLAAAGVTAAAFADALLDVAHGVEAAAGAEVDAGAFRARLHRLVRLVVRGAGGRGGS